MAITTGNVQTFSDAELLLMWRAAAAALATGQEYTMGGRNGRSLTRADWPQVQAAIKYFEGRINDAANDDGGGFALVRYGERV